MLVRFHIVHYSDKIFLPTLEVPAYSSWSEKILSICIYVHVYKNVYTGKHNMLNGARLLPIVLSC